MAHTATPAITARLVDSLYTEALLLADEARSYFEHGGRADRDRLAGAVRVGFSCESLRVTTRLMHVIAWLLNQRAVAVGEISVAQAASPERRLGRVADSDDALVAVLPDTAREIVAAASDLYARVARLEARVAAPPPVASPALGLIARLEGAF